MTRKKNEITVTKSITIGIQHPSDKITTVKSTVCLVMPIKTLQKLFRCARRCRNALKTSW